MALINGQIFGDMKGKLGGMVFSRNNAGKTIRAYVVPTDAKSQQQISVRSGFATAVSKWNSLTAAFRTNWNSFAATIFKPKRGSKATAYSGYQAFASLNLLLKSLTDHDYTAHFSPTTITATLYELADAIAEPPVVQFNATIQTSAADPLSLAFSNAAFTPSTGLFSFTLGLNPAPQASAPIFKNPITDEPVGFALYASTVISPGSSRAPNLEAYLLGIVNPIDTITGWSSASEFTMTWTVPSDYLNALKAGFATGQDIFVTAYAISGNGQAAKIGMIRVTCT
jgi:hypothetical protein